MILSGKIHNMRPIGSQAIRETHSTETHVPEAHAVENKGRGNYNNRDRRRGNFRGRGRGRGQGCGNINGHGRKFQRFGRGHFPQNCQNGYYNNNSQRGKQVEYQNKNSHQEGKESICYNCGMTGHWARTCRTAKHFVELYLASQKKKGKDFYLDGDKNDKEYDEDI
ncbi:uncharacterized protein LOC130828570 [Amaranthus tricolor]|uniref:uncharacterized protein LOC130828570 n=1 Tax=Amaranthus tricolor TaxID=29722 RepID=UPI00258C20AE|nr:uncharacterized protein LOC130828570 [Amaranthus tricolor]